MNLTKREKAALALDPCACFNSKFNCDERFWLGCKDCLKARHREHCAQTKAYHRQKNGTTNVANSTDHADSDPSDDYEPESEDSTIAPFSRSVPHDSSNRNRNISETQKRINDGEAVDIEFEQVASN